ncbi:MAG: DUF1656 domain-containing protein [Planctomycetota bacterium]|jgi:hypothetical protein
MQHIPSEFDVGGVFMPPAFIAALLGILAASITARLLNRYRFSRFFYYPPLVYVGLVVIYTCIVGTLFIPF